MRSKVSDLIPRAIVIQFLSNDFRVNQSARAASKNSDLVELPVPYIKKIRVV